MTLRRVVAMSSGPHAMSRTARLVDIVLDRVKSETVKIDHISLRKLDPTALLHAVIDHPDARMLSEKLACADGLIIGTPVYKAAYSGLLKSALDVLPQFGLAGKVVLPLATGGSIAHVLALDYALRPVLQSMGARHVVQSCFVTESDCAGEPDRFVLSANADARLDAAIANFLHSLTHPTPPGLLGHPRPGQSC